MLGRRSEVLQQMVSKVNGTVSTVLFYAYVQVLLLLSIFIIILQNFKIVHQQSNQAIQNSYSPVLPTTFQVLTKSSVSMTK